MQINLNGDDMRLIVLAMQVLLERTNVPARQDRLIVLIDRFEKAIERHPAKHQRALATTARLKRERVYPASRRGGS